MNFYLSKYGFLPAQLTESVHPETGIIIVIPCFNEPYLISSLQSLAACDHPSCVIEVLVVINSGIHHSEVIKEQNKKSFAAFKHFKNTQNSPFNFHCIFINDLPKKHAGVGLARKIGMDEAVARFDHIDTDGIIVCFDADAKVETNYLVEIEKHFKRYPKSPACSIHFEHPTKGDDYEAEIYEGIKNYELHLRYYNQAMKYANLPFAYHTVGSSMAVRASAYQKQGGMNKRKAGEDFYFIHKIIALGNFSELKTTKVIPSPRESDRVPFGTGRAIADWIAAGKAAYQSYDLNSFDLIRTFVSETGAMYRGELPFISDAFNLYLTEQDFESRLREIRNNTTDYESFLKRFFVWLDAFQVLKIVHFLRDHQFPNQSLIQSANQLLSRLDPSKSQEYGLEKLLDEFRLLEKS